MNGFRISYFIIRRIDRLSGMLSGKSRTFSIAQRLMKEYRSLTDLQIYIAIFYSLNDTKIPEIIAKQSSQECFYVE